MAKTPEDLEYEKWEKKTVKAYQTYQRVATQEKKKYELKIAPLKEPWLAAQQAYKEAVEPHHKAYVLLMEQCPNLNRWLGVYDAVDEIIKKYKKVMEHGKTRSIEG